MVKWLVVYDGFLEVLSFDQEFQDRQGWHCDLVSAYCGIGDGSIHSCDEMYYVIVKYPYWGVVIF